jgi:hypothetical protein
VFIRGYLIFEFQFVTNSPRHENGYRLSHFAHRNNGPLVETRGSTGAAVACHFRCCA